MPSPLTVHTNFKILTALRNGGIKGRTVVRYLKIPSSRKLKSV